MTSHHILTPQERQLSDAIARQFRGSLQRYILRSWCAGAVTVETSDPCSLSPHQVLDILQGELEKLYVATPVEIDQLPAPVVERGRVMGAFDALLARLAIGRAR